MLVRHIPACRSELQPYDQTMVPLVRIAAITQQLQVISRCTKIPNWSYQNVILEVKAPVGLCFKLTSLIIIAFSDSFTPDYDISHRQMRKFT